MKDILILKEGKKWILKTADLSSFKILEQIIKKLACQLLEMERNKNFELVQVYQGHERQAPCFLLW